MATKTVFASLPSTTKFWSRDTGKREICTVGLGLSLPKASPARIALLPLRGSRISLRFPFNMLRCVSLLLSTWASLTIVDILEYSNIAWPNAAMWSHAPRLFKYNSGSTYSSDPKEAEDTHAHSPTRRELRSAAADSQTSNAALYNAWAYRNLPAPLAQWQSRETRLSQEPFISDPFIDPYVLDNSSARARGARSSTEDVPMPDYAGSSSASSRAFSSMTGVSYEHSKQPSLGGPIDEVRYNQLVETVTAPKSQGPGTQAPVNTPSGAAPLGRRLSAAAEARTASYSGGGSRSSILREISQRGSRNISETSTKSSLAADTIEAVSRKLQVSPSGVAGQVRGKKEGSENKENEGSVDTPLTEIRTPSKLVHTSGSVDSGSRKNRSGSHVSKEEPLPLLTTPTRGLQPAADDSILQGSLEDFFDSRIHLGGVICEASEID